MLGGSYGVKHLTAPEASGVNQLDSAVSNLSTATIRNKPETNKDRITPLNPPVTPGEAPPQPERERNKQKEKAELALRDLRRERAREDLERVAPASYRLWRRMKKAMRLRDRLAEAQAESLLEGGRRARRSRSRPGAARDAAPNRRPRLATRLPSPTRSTSTGTARLARESQRQPQFQLEEGERITRPRRGPREDSGAAKEPSREGKDMTGPEQYRLATARPYRIRVVELMDAAVNIKVLDKDDKSVIAVTLRQQLQGAFARGHQGTLGGAID